jgi:hypothetical protein
MSKVAYHLGRAAKGRFLGKARWRRSPPIHGLLGKRPAEGFDELPTEPLTQLRDVAKAEFFCLLVIVSTVIVAGGGFIGAGTPATPTSPITNLADAPFKRTLSFAQPY